MEVGQDITVDSGGDAFAIGGTASSDFPITAGAVVSALPGSSSSAGYLSNSTLQGQPSCIPRILGAAVVIEP